MSYVISSFVSMEDTVRIALVRPYITERSSSVFNLSGKRFFTLSKCMKLTFISQILLWKITKWQRKVAISVTFCLF